MYYIYKPVYVHFFSVISWSILIHDKLKSSLCLSTFHDYCRAYLSTDDVFPNDDSGIVALLNSKDLESKACVVKDTTSPILPTQAMQAFRLLNENTAAQVPFLFISHMFLLHFQVSFRFIHYSRTLYVPNRHLLELL